MQAVAALSGLAFSLIACLGDTGQLQAAGNPFPLASRYTDLPTENIPINLQVHGIQRFAYKGSSYTLNPEKRFQVSAPLQNRVLAALGSTDFIPYTRLEHFNWCNRSDLVIVGWNGVIEEIKQTSQGLIVQIRVAPKLAKVGVIAPQTLDSFTETYVFGPDFRFKLVDGARSENSYRGSVMGF